jgi:hypothetical protein
VASGNFVQAGDCAREEVAQALARAERIVGILQLEALVVRRQLCACFGVGQSLEDAVVTLTEAGIQLQR